MQRAGDVRALAHMEQQSMELGRVALMGSRDDKPQTTACPLRLLKQLEKLKRQKFELENKIRAGELSVEDFPTENLTKEYITQGITHLENEIEKLKVAHHNKSLLLRRMQFYDALHRKLSEKNTESKMIHDTMEHSMGLCQQILKSQKETLALEEKLINLRRKRMELKETCTEVMTELRSMKESDNNKFSELDNANFRKINKYIAKEIDITTVIQNVFQRLILGSCVNWAEDPKLKEIVLTLGKNPASF
ncbi:centromere protein H [Leptodactylus fuscus]|uniref:centromere protein H n=1 Tax=Leptodactylus fuscus TaxID=238119 RepID=UPI003F4E4B43